VRQERRPPHVPIAGPRRADRNAPVEDFHSANLAGHGSWRVGRRLATRQRHRTRSEIVRLRRSTSPSRIPAQNALSAAISEAFNTMTWRTTFMAAELSEGRSDHRRGLLLPEHGYLLTSVRLRVEQSLVTDATPRMLPSETDPPSASRAHGHPAGGFAAQQLDRATDHLSSCGRNRLRYISGPRSATTRRTVGLNYRAVNTPT
jgi:hypothetical protein